MDKKDLKKNIESDETAAEVPEKEKKKKTAAPVYDERTMMDAADVIAARKKAKRRRIIIILIPIVIIASIVRFLVTDIDFIMKTYFRFCRSEMELVSEYVLENWELSHISSTEGNSSYLQSHDFPPDVEKAIKLYFRIMKVPYIHEAEDRRLVFFHVDGRESEETFNIYNRNYSDYFYCYAKDGEQALTEYLQQEEDHVPFEISNIKDDWYVVIKLYKIKAEEAEDYYESNTNNKQRQ